MQDNCEISPHQESFSASTSPVKLICVPVRMVPGPLSLLLKQDVVGERVLSVSQSLMSVIGVHMRKEPLIRGKKLRATREPCAQEG